VKVGGGLSSGNGEVLRSWALSGECISLEAFWDVEDDLAAGDLVEVLPQYKSSEPELYAVFAPTKPTPPRIRLFVDLLV
jgi:LysR family transcriptional activator of dmlA